MPDGEQMNPVLFHLKRINDSIVANASTKTIRSLQAMMLKRFEPQPDFIATSRLEIAAIEDELEGVALPETMFGSSVATA